MPIYEYKCQLCSDLLEVKQSFEDDPLTEAEGCEESKSGLHQLKKKFGSPAIAFKGQGFYKNDTRGTDSVSSSSSDTSAQTSSEAS